MKNAVVVVLITLLVAGCGSTGSGQEEFNASESLVAAGNYKEAVAYLESALAKEPDNVSYRNALNSAKAKAGNQLIQDANALLSVNNVNISNLELARSRVEEAKKYVSDTQTSPIIDRINKTQEELIENVKNYYAQALTAIDTQDWVKAHFALNKVTQRYPNFERSGPLSSQVRSEGTRDYLQLAKQLFDKYDYELAQQTARKVLTLDRNNPIAKKFLETIQQNNNATFFSDLAQQAAQNKDWEQVIFACDKVSRFNTDDEACANMHAIAKTNQMELELKDGNSFLRTGYVMKAAAKLTAAKKILNGEPNPDTDGFSQGLQDFLNTKADSLIEEGYYGVAWYLLNMLRDINPSTPNLFNKTKFVEDRIIERVKKSIAVFDFKSPSYNQDSGVLIANNLIANLFNSASQDINILERENLKSILEEMKLGQIGVVSENTAKEMGRIYGIDVAIMGSVLIFKAEESNSQSSETVRYQVGEEIQDNIEYLNWKARNPNPSRSDLENSPTPKIMVPTYVEKEYDVTNAKKVGFIEISFRIVDVTTGQNTRVETIERKKIVEDTSNEGVKDAGVVFDPLEMVTDTELLQLMTDEVVEELSLKVLQPLRNQEREYFDRAEELFLRRKENLNAVEEFVNAIFDERVKSIVNSPIANQSDAYITKIIDSHRFIE